MARLGKIINDADLNGGYAFNDPSFRKKDEIERERFTRQLARKTKFYLEHSHSAKMDGDEF
jgi:hypothetical protein